MAARPSHLDHSVAVGPSDRGPCDGARLARQRNRRRRERRGSEAALSDLPARARARSQEMIVAWLMPTSPDGSIADGEDRCGAGAVAAASDERRRSIRVPFASHHGSSHGAASARYRPQSSSPYHSDPTATSDTGVGSMTILTWAVPAPSLAPDW
jgi:hypothetical protein